MHEGPPAVTVEITATDDVAVTRMRLANEDGVWEPWQACAPSVLHVLSAKAGFKGVSVQVADAGWETSSTIYTRTTLANDDAETQRAVLGTDEIDVLMLFSGGSTSDAITGNEAILGGAGADVIDTGSKDTSFEGNGFIWAGAGNDVVIKRQTVRELDCGAGYDIVYEATSTHQGANETRYTGCEEILPMS